MWRLCTIFVNFLSLKLFFLKITKKVPHRVMNNLNFLFSIIIFLIFFYNDYVHTVFLFK